MKRGEVRWASLAPPWGRRPVLLLARDDAYSVLTAVMVAPLTTTIRRAPSLVYLAPRRDDVPEASVVILDNILSVRPSMIETLITRLSDERMAEVERAARFALGMRG
ncbi:MAG: type II toxin-antitoxin system PemK/MazF family toxin [Chloroflexota bacterium]